MKENNDHILAQAIQDLPVHRPEEFMWDKLETSLFSFPVEELPMHQPDAALWTDIQHTLSQPKTSFTNFRKTGLILIALLFTTLIGFKGYQYHQKNNLTLMTIKQNDKETNSTIKEISETAEKKISQKTGQPAPLTSTTNIKNTQPIFEEKPTTAEQNYIIEKETYFAPITKQGGVGIASNSTSKLLLIASQHQEECAITPISLRKRGLNQNNAFLLPGHCVNTECSPFSGNTPYFSVSLWGSTALFIEGNKTQDTKLINWMSLELDLTYHKGNLFFTTGLGAVYSTDQSKITYDYLQNELIDSYIYVDSVYYDPITGTTQYYTTTVNVYDSIEHADQSQYNNHYKYIKIPFNVGYEVYKNQYIGISLSGGISWIHQINTQAKIPIIQKENSRILQTHFNEIIRNKDLFQLSAQLAMNINLSRRVNLQFGLGYHYFTQPLYQNQTVKNPVSWSMGTGIQYKF